MSEMKHCEYRCLGENMKTGRPYWTCEAPCKKCPANKESALHSRLGQMEAALRKLTTVNENQMVSGGWVAKIAREALQSAVGEMKRFWEPTKESSVPTAPSNSGGWMWTCNACKMNEPCIHMAEAEGWLPKSCIRIGNTTHTSTIRVQCKWKIRGREK